MGFAATQAYREKIAKRLFKSPLKLRHIWIPLGFFLITIYRNQAISQLSFPEAAVGLGIAFISFLPLFMWASKTEREVPAFQCFCAVHFPFYGYPILCCKAEYMAHPEADRLLADISVLAFLVVANLIYYIGISRMSKRGPVKVLAYRELSERTAQSLFTLLLAGWATFLVMKNFGYLRWLGAGTNVVNTFACGGGTVALWVLSRQMGENRLTGGHKAFVLALIFVGLFVSFATCTLIAGFIMLIVGVVGYSLTCQKIPWVTILTSLFLMSFLNLGKFEMRRTYWPGGVQPYLSVEKTIEIYRNWLPTSWEVMWSGLDRGKKAQQLLDRANLIQIHTLVVRHTPADVPYLWGETYKYILFGLVPRLLWPTKPHGHMATTILGLNYKVANAGSLQTTTVGFGYLPEAWANFGWWGIVGLAIVIGFTMQAVARSCQGAGPLSLHSLLSVVWVAWSFQIELPISTWFASFAQAVLAILVMCYLFSYRTTPVTMGSRLSYSSV